MTSLTCLESVQSAFRVSVISEVIVLRRMPRKPPVYSDFFYNPLTEDVEQLLARFQHTDSVRYELFSAIWREMSFSDVFRGISSVAELKRFCRVALATAVKFFLPPYSYQVRVGGLYLMFGLYHTQLAIPPVKIRLALRDWTPIQKFLKDSLEYGHQDVVYIYEKLVATKAIHYTAMPHFLIFQKQMKPKRDAVCTELIGRSTAVQDLFSADILEELSNIQNHYEQLKEATAEVSCQGTMTHRKFSAQLKDCMSEFFTWQQKTFSQENKGKKSVVNCDKDEDEDGDGNEDEMEKDAAAESSSRARLLSSIKQKSYSNIQEAPKSRRHRQAKRVESSSSGAEQVQETGAGQRKRPPSLRARTQKSLGVTRDDSRLQAWLLSAPKKQERMVMKRTNQAAPFKHDA
ncbi:snRNA-activating protein complex subunit 1-like [Etheostoma cragini]|uniref:snRNA-activating protein complex subunit 1-like n=1 Tax=Etheostoma cragini TaxID=417921 RepID=UPI00155EDB07|nr:snRNA-activating protein complex subunit 1-like [Etheostoma cragini]